jgi:dTDP-4-amino-4,6-dideoxygalactose transaminase
MIPQAAPQLRIARFRSAIDARIAAVLSSTSYILGPEVERFETEFAAYIGAAHCVGVASGTDALALSLRVLGIGPGDEVITVAMTASPTVAAILQCGAQPAFVDVDATTRCIDVEQIAAAVTSRTAAIVPVHLHGHPVAMAAVMEVAARRGLAVVEDCAQAHGTEWQGRRVGTFGHMAAFSFFPTKNLGGVGDGGAIVTSDAARAARARSLRTYGWTDARRISTEPGWNSRLSEIQAAILNVLLPELDDSNGERRRFAQLYRRDLSAALDVSEIAFAAEESGSVHHQFAIEVEQRDAVRKHLAEVSDIATGVHYSPGLHQHPAYARFAAWPLPVTERLARRMISLPIQPEVVDNQERRIVQSVIGAVRACHQP